MKKCFLASVIFFIVAPCYGDNQTAAFLPLDYFTSQKSSNHPLPSKSGAHLQSSINSWMIYAGAFGGFLNTHFADNAIYFSFARADGFGGSVFLNADTLQTGASGGGQIGIQYHFHSPYFLALTFSGISNANQARISKLVEDGIASPEKIAFDIHNNFEIRSALDLTAILGADLTSQAHVYVKLGTSDGRLEDNLFITRAQNSSAPEVFPEATFKKNVWGFLLGLGFTYDLNRWISAFAEYDHYNYGIVGLPIAQDIDPAPKTVPFVVPPNSLQQQVRVNADALRVGLNLKFNDNPHPRLHLGIINPWMLYLGGFGGYANVNFLYDATYFTIVNPVVGGNQTFNNFTPQTGSLGGGQIGIQYHFHSPYFIGLSFSGMSNTNNKARFTNFIDNLITQPVSTSFTIHQAFRLKTSLDLAILLGADINPSNHVYAKLGGTEGQVESNLVTSAGEQFPSPVFTAEQTENISIGGFVFGLGIRHDLNRWVDVFAECDYHNYGGLNLSTLANINPSASASNPDLLKRHVSLTDNVLYVGLNLKFGDNPHLPLPHGSNLQPWMLYLGGFGGYSSTTFAYSATYFSTVVAPVGGNVIFNNTTFQRGDLAGGQIGIQYHTQRDYFFGLLFSANNNYKTAHLTNNVNNAFASPLHSAFDIHNEFRLRYNLDIAALIGADITPNSHLYIKLGGADGQFRDSFFTTAAQGSSIPVVSFQSTTNKTGWGFVLGLGLTYDLSQRFSVFAEYDHYNYGTLGLPTFNNINPSFIPANPDSLTDQSVAIMVNSFRVGLNVYTLD